MPERHNLSASQQLLAHLLNASDVGADEPLSALSVAFSPLSAASLDTDPRRSTRALRGALLFSAAALAALDRLLAGLLHAGWQAGWQTPADVTIGDLDALVRRDIGRGLPRDPAKADKTSSPGGWTSSATS
jgi:hypothetical protein